MPLWGNSALANNAPKYHILDTSTARGNTMYANTFLDAFIPGAVAGVYPANPQAVANNGYKVTHDGWIVVRKGTGPVVSISPLVAGSGYANSDVLSITSFDPGKNTTATASILTNGSGAIQSLTLLTHGSGFLGSESPTVANSTGGASAGTGATFTVKFGGRTNRTTYETLVAAGSINSTTDLP
jgi:hypothetical protein